jgi:hypothetical protein
LVFLSSVIVSISWFAIRGQFLAKISKTGVMIGDDALGASRVTAIEPFARSELGPTLWFAFDGPEAALRSREAEGKRTG